MSMNLPLLVWHFNVNDTPNLQGSLEAILGRYGVLAFNKTFKVGADATKGEIEADPRFKYDSEFLRSEVLPAFLNRVLQALKDLMRDGIDYSCTQQALEAIQAENSHLFCVLPGYRTRIRPLPVQAFSQPGKPGKPVSTSGEEIESSLTKSEQPEQSNSEKADQAGKLPYLAYHPGSVNNTGLPDTLPSALPATTTALPTDTSAKKESAIAFRPTQQPLQSATVVPAPSELATIILGCKTWTAAVESMDAVAAAVGKQRQAVFRSVLKHIPSLEDKQHLVRLLADHIQRFPLDYQAYNWLPESCRKLKEKALALAQGNKPGEE